MTDHSDLVALKEQIFTIAKCTHHEDDALAFLEDNYDALVGALEAAALIETQAAELERAGVVLTAREEG